MMDYATVHGVVWAFLALFILFEKKPERSGLAERSFFAFAMLLWPILLPIILFFAFKNRGKP
jgi:hypothetical protein